MKEDLLPLELWKACSKVMKTEKKILVSGDYIILKTWILLYSMHFCQEIRLNSTHWTFQKASDIKASNFKKAYFNYLKWQTKHNGVLLFSDGKTKQVTDIVCIDFMSESLKHFTSSLMFWICMWIRFRSFANNRRKDSDILLLRDSEKSRDPSEIHLNLAESQLWRHWKFCFMQFDWNI